MFLMRYWRAPFRASAHTCTQRHAATVSTLGRSGACAHALSQYTTFCLGGKKNLFYGSFCSGCSYVISRRSNLCVLQSSFSHCFRLRFSLVFIETFVAIKLIVSHICFNDTHSSCQIQICANRCRWINNEENGTFEYSRGGCFLSPNQNCTGKGQNCNFHRKP